MSERPSEAGPAGQRSANGASGDDRSDGSGVNAAMTDPRQLALAMSIRPGASFENFLPGENLSTLGALERLLALTDSGALAGEARGLDVAPPVTRSGGFGRTGYLCGPAAAGKTHLLEAACRAGAGARMRCAYFSPAQQEPVAPDILVGWGEFDLVCVDDLDRTAGNAEWETALFHLYNQLDAGGGRILLAARNPPRQLGLKLPDLESRLNASLVLPLVPLAEAGQQAALKARAAERGLEMSDEVARYVMRRTRRDMRSLMQVLDQLDERTLAAQRRLTVPFVRELL